LLQEGLDPQQALRDIIKVAAGAGAVVLTGGMGGDTAVDIVFAMESADDVLGSVDAAVSAGGELGGAVDAALGTNISSGPDAIYDAVLQVAIAAAEAGGEEALAAAKEEVDGLLGDLAGSVGDWVATALPDDAGLGGIAVREAIEAAIGAASESVYDVIKGAFNGLPSNVQSFVSDPAAFEQFMNELLDQIVEMLQGLMSSNETGEEQGGIFSYVASQAKEAITAGPQGIVMNLAMAETVPEIVEFLDGTIRGKIPVAAQILNKLVSAAFGAVALLQIIVKEEWKSDEEKQKEKEAKEEEDKQPAEEQNENLLIRGYIRQMLLEDFNLGKGTGIEYTALVLDDASHNQLASMAPEGWSVYAHHMTIISPPNSSTRLPSRWLGESECVSVVGIASDDKVMTALIDVRGAPIPMKGPAFPHVTIATNPKEGGKPVMSNSFSKEDFRPVGPIKICGTIEEIMK